MPTYEYECLKCPRTFEVRQRISEPALTTCDRCGGPVHRLIGPAAFILKGEGWYVTDYPSESRKKAMKSESTSASSGSTDGKSSTPAASDSSSSSSSSASSSSTSSGGAAGGTSGSSKPASKD